MPDDVARIAGQLTEAQRKFLIEENASHRLDNTALANALRRKGLVVERWRQPTPLGLRVQSYVRELAGRGGF